MALESVTYVGDLTATNPTAADPKSQGDDHIRNLKTAVRTSFAGFTGPILVTGVDGGAADAYTLTPITAVPAYVTKMLIEFTPVATNVTTTPTLNVSAVGAKTIKSVADTALVAGDLVVSVPTLVVFDGVNLRLLGPTKNYIDQLAFSAVLPSQAGNAGKRLETDGANASWEDDPDYDQFTAVAMGALDIDCSAGNYFTKTITAGLNTFTISNAPAAGFSFTLDLQHDGGTFALPASVKPANDTFPTFTSGKTHLLFFVTRNGGTRWRVGVLPNGVN